MKKNFWNDFKIVAAAMSGHVLEFFDFTIYAVFAVELGQLFFPNASPFAQTLSSLGVFAAGFFMRPIGGIVFGHIGDRYGRRLALIISVVGMAVITLAIAFLPDYESIGIAAPIILVTLRLIQGLCIGGEGAGSSIFVLEHLSNIKPGLVGGIVNGSLTLGILLAVVTGFLLHTYFPGDPNVWRYAFFIGGVLGIGGLYLMLAVEETPVFKEMQKQEQIVALPIKEVFQNNLKGVILTVAAGALTSTSAYLIMTFLGVFLKTVMEYDSIEALEYSMLGNFALMLFLPLMGAVSDQLGYIKTMVLSSLLGIALSIPIFSMIASGDALLMKFGILLLSSIVAGIYAPLYPFMLRMFTPSQRYSGIACSLNIGIAIFGGMTTVACIWLIDFTGHEFAAAYWWSFACALFIFTLMYVKKTSIVKLLTVNDSAAKAQYMEIYS